MTAPTSAVTRRARVTSVTLHCAEGTNAGLTVRFDGPTALGDATQYVNTAWRSDAPSSAEGGYLKVDCTLEFDGGRLEWRGRLDLQSDVYCDIGSDVWVAIERRAQDRQPAGMADAAWAARRQQPDHLERRDRMREWYDAVDREALTAPDTSPTRVEPVIVTPVARRRGPRP